MFSGRINLYIYNIEKTFCTPATKEVSVPFQPYEGMRIFSAGSEYVIDSLQWNIDDNSFNATVFLYPEWVGDSFIDDEFYRDEATRQGWNVLKGYEVDSA